jgi:hypothetical protein
MPSAALETASQANANVDFSHVFNYRDLICYLFQYTIASAQSIQPKSRWHVWLSEQVRLQWNRYLLRILLLRCQVLRHKPVALRQSTGMVSSYEPPALSCRPPLPRIDLVSYVPSQNLC